jgi:hypothetical protein
MHPNLSLPGITTDELIALRERFALLVKLPEEYAGFIARSETDDETGRRLFGELLNIYEEAVLQHGDSWDPGRSVAEDVRLLTEIGASDDSHGIA